jgi:hypothetical protein
LIVPQIRLLRTSYLVLLPTATATAYFVPRSGYLSSKFKIQGEDKLKVEELTGFHKS